MMMTMNQTSYFQTVGVSIKGTRHEEKGLPCQDYIAYKAQNGVLTLVVSDGAGSLMYSDHGAKITAETALNYVSLNFAALLEADDFLTYKTELINKIVNNIKEEALQNEVSYQEFGATLVFVATNGKETLIGHLGDGIIGAYCRDTGPTILSLEEKLGAVNETVFVTNKDSINYFKLEKTSEVYAGFVVSSDGAENALLDKNVPLKPVFQKAVTTMFKWFDEHEINDVASGISSTIKTQFKKRSNDDISVIFAVNTVSRTAYHALTKQEKYALFAEYKYQKTRDKAFALSESIIAALITPWEAHEFEKKLRVKHLDFNRVLNILAVNNVIQVTNGIIKLN